MRTVQKIRFSWLPRKAGPRATGGREPGNGTVDARFRGREGFLQAPASRGRMPRRQGGFSLVELMVALLLGLLLMSGIIAVYLEGKNNFVQDEAISRVQENGRYALRLLTREIAMGGFYGGATEPAAITSPAGGTCQHWLLKPDQVIETYNYADGGLGAAFGTCVVTGTSGAVAGTDVIAVRRASDAPLILHGNWQNGLSALTGTQYYLHTDNSGLGSTEIQPGSALSPSTLTATGSTADLWDYFGRIYYIGTENGVPSLCTRSAQNTTQTCLVSGVESLQLELGVDTSGDGIPNRFISGAVKSGGVDVATVISMRVHLLMRSLEPVRNFAAESRTWELGDQTLTTNDQYYRRVFTATVPRNNQLFTTFQ